MSLGGVFILAVHDLGLDVVAEGVFERFEVVNVELKVCALRLAAEVHIEGRVRTVELLYPRRLVLDVDALGVRLELALEELRRRSFCLGTLCERSDQFESAKEGYEGAPSSSFRACRSRLG